MNERLVTEIKKMQSGDFSGYQEFYDTTCTFTYSVISSVVPGDMNDVMNQTYQNIYSRINEVTDTERFYSWVGLIATDNAVQWLKNMNSFSISSVIEHEYEAEEETEERCIPQSMMQDSEAKRILQSRLDQLSVIDKIVMQYYYYESQPVDVIAGKLECDTRVVKAALREIKNVVKDVAFGYYGNTDTPLYSVDDIPIIWLCFEEALGFPIGNLLGFNAIIGGMAGITAQGVTGIGAQGAAGLGTQGAIGAGTQGAIGAGTQGAVGIGAQGAVAGEMSAIGGGAASAVAAKSATGLLSALWVKIGLGIAGVALIAGGAVGIKYAVDKHNSKGNANTTEVTVEVATMEDAVVEETEEATTEETTEEEVKVPEGEYKLVCVEEVYGSRGEDTYESYDKLEVQGEGYEALTQTVEAWNAQCIQNIKENYCDDFYRINNYIEAAEYSLRSDSKILSMVMLGEDSDSYGIVLNPITGKQLTLSDMGDIKDDVKAAVIQNLKDRNLTGNLVSDYESVIDTMFENDEVNWCMDGFNIYVLFNSGEIFNGITPDSNSPFLNRQFYGYPENYGNSNTICISMPIDTLAGFDDQYKATELKSGHFNIGYDLNCDIDGDGENETLGMSVFDVYEYIDGHQYHRYAVSITVDGKQVWVEDPGCDYVIEIGYYFENKAGEKYCIFTMCAVGIGDHNKVYKIESGKFVEVNYDMLNTNCGWVQPGMFYGNNFNKLLIRNVSAIGAGCYILKRYSNWSYYTLNDKNIIRDNNNCCYVLSEIFEETGEITAKEDIPAKIQDESGDMVDGIIPAGMSIEVSWCNDDTFGFYMSDGRYGELNYEFDSEELDEDSYLIHRININGRKETELFENVYYGYIQ